MQATSVSDFQRRNIPSKSRLSGIAYYLISLHIYEGFESYLMLLLTMTN